MNIWIIKDGEPLPVFDQAARLMRVANLGEYLSKSGHTVTWWTSTWSHYQRRKYIACDHNYHVNPNFEIRMLDSVGYKKNISFRRLLHYTTIAKRFTEQAGLMQKPDLIICALPTVEIAYAATRFAKKISCPILIDCRDRWPDIMIEVFPSYLRSIVRICAHYQFAMMTHVCKNATGFLGISEPFIAWAANYAGRKPNEHDLFLPLVSPNFTALSEASEHTETADFFKEKGIVFEGKFTAVFAGNYKKTSDLTPVIAAFSQLPDDCQLLIAGNASGNEAIEQQYRQLTEKRPNVHLLGWLNVNQLDYLYRRSHIAIVPYANKDYFSMNLTNKAIEYLYYGLPILTSVKGYLSDLLEKNQIGYHYNTAQVEQIVEMILTLEKDRPLLQAMRDRCQKLHQDMFDYDTVMLKFSDFLKTHFEQKKELLDA